MNASFMYHNLGVREQECTREHYEGGKDDLGYKNEKEASLLSAMRQQTDNLQRTDSPGHTERADREQAGRAENEHTEGRMQSMRMHKEQ